MISTRFVHRAESSANEDGVPSTGETNPGHERNVRRGDIDINARRRLQGVLSGRRTTTCSPLSVCAEFSWWSGRAMCPAVPRARWPGLIENWLGRLLGSRGRLDVGSCAGQRVFLSAATSLWRPLVVSMLGSFPIGKRNAASKGNLLNRSGGKICAHTNMCS